jgi:peptide deformylase
VVTVFDDSLAQTAKEMLLIMYAAEGVGLAAPQVCLHKKKQFASVFCLS